MVTQSCCGSDQRESASPDVASHASAESAPSPHALAPLLHRPLRESDAPLNGVAVGRVVGVDGVAVRVVIPTLGPQELVARTLFPLPADWDQRDCAVLFENGDRTRPLLVGLMLDAPASAPSPVPAPVAAPDRTLRVDGQQVVIQADAELELRCGESVILLQRDGRIEIRGNYITSQATATQRLRGGSIHMN